MGECVLLAASSSWGSTDRKVWELLLQGNLGTSAHMEQCRGVLVAAGSRAECASVSSVFGFVCLNANEEKIISSREALYQLLLGGKKPNPAVSAGLSSLLHTALQGAAPCKGTGKGDVWTLSWPVHSPRGKNTLLSVCSILTPQSRSGNYVQNQWQVHNSQGSSGAVGNNSPLIRRSCSLALLLYPEVQEKMAHQVIYNSPFLKAVL